MVCQSLQAVAAFLRFDWNEGTPYRDLFRARLFDFWAKLEPPADPPPRHRGWGAGTPAAPASTARSRWSTPMRPGAISLAAAQRERRSRAVPGRDTRPADGLPGPPARGDGARGEGLPRQQADGEDAVRSARPGGFEQKARTLAHALQEFVTIERHVDAGGLEAGALAPPEQRVLAGQTLVVRYVEEDQEPGVAEKNRENERRRRLKEAQRRLPRGTPGRQADQAFQGRASGVGLVAGGDAVPAAPGVHRRRLRPRRGPGPDHAEAGRLAGDQSPLDRRQSPAGRGAASRVHPDRQADALRHAGRAGADHGHGATATGRSRPGPRS